MSALGHKRTFAPQKACPLYPRKRTFAAAVAMSALCQKRICAEHYMKEVGKLSF